MNIIDKILARRSERAYLPKPIEKAKLEQLIAVINSSTTSTNSQDFSAIIVDDHELRQKVSLGAATQKHVIDAPLFIIFCADKNRIEYAAKQKQTAIHTNTLNNFLTASGDAFIAATLAGAAALELGLGFCYIGLVRRNLLAITQALNLTGSIVPVVGLTIGYIDKQNEVKPKINHVYHGQYNVEQLQQEVVAYDEQMATYYDERNANKKPNSKWTEVCLLPFSKPEVEQPIDAFMKEKWQLK